MGAQTGPYREAETIDEEDIRRITGVLYGGKTLPSAVGFLGNAERDYDSCDRHRWYSFAWMFDEALSRWLSRPARH